MRKSEKIGVALLLLTPLLALASVEIKSGASTSKATVDSAYSALRVSVQPRSKDCYSVTATTGAVGAALAANGTIFAMRNSPTASKTAYVYRARYEYINGPTAGTTTAGVQLHLVRGTGAAASGQTALDTSINKKDSAGAANSNVTAALGGDVRISNTAALTVTGITWETGPFNVCYVGHILATANGGKVCDWSVDDHNMHAIELEPGQLLGIKNGSTAFPATNPSQVGAISVEWCEY